MRSLNIVMEMIMPKAVVNRTGTIFCKSHMLQAYADNIDIIGLGLRDVTATFSCIEKQSADVGLVINEEKTKLFVSKNKEFTRLGRFVNVENYNFYVVDDFVYLRSAINKNNNVSLKIRTGILIAIHYYPALSKLFTDKSSLEKQRSN